MTRRLQMQLSGADFNFEESNTQNIALLLYNHDHPYNTDEWHHIYTEIRGFSDSTRDSIPVNTKTKQTDIHIFSQPTCSCIFISNRQALFQNYYQ